MLWFNKNNELLESIKKNEGFESKPYIDVLVNQAPEQHGIPPDEFEIIKKHLNKLKLTFGHGFTYITEKEAEKVAQMRLKELETKVKENYPHVKNSTVLSVLTEMAFQLGLNGLSKFKKMHKAIQNKEYIIAANEMKNSKWFAQTPNRVKKLANLMKNA